MLAPIRAYFSHPGQHTYPQSSGPQSQASYYYHHHPRLLNSLFKNMVPPLFPEELLPGLI